MVDFSNDENDKKLRPAIYLRVSTEDQVEKYGLSLQEDAIKSFINNRYDYLDFTHAKIYRDEGKSGTLSIKDRPGLKQLFDDIKYSIDGKSPFDVVVVYRIDRFARDLKVLLDIVDELKKNDVSFASTQELIDTTTAFGKAMLGILGVFAELDRDMILQKMSSGKDQALLSGVWYKSKFGYDRNKDKRPVINKEQADIVKEMFYMFGEQKYSISKITKIFTEKKIPIPVVWDNDNLVRRPVKDPYKWTDKTVRKILGDEVYIGEYYYHKQKTIFHKDTGKKLIKDLPKEQWKLSPIGHSPIVDRDTFNKVQSLLDRKKGNFNRSNDYILGGLIKCDYCKEDKVKGMVGWTGIKSNGSQYYQCAGKNVQKFKNTCSTIPLPKGEFEDIVKAEIKNIILNPNAIKKYLQKTKGSNESQIIIQNDIEKGNDLVRKLFDNMANLEELFTSGKSNQTSSEYLEIRQKIAQSIDQKKLEIRDLENRLIREIEEEKQILAMNYLKNIIGNLEDVFDSDEKCKELFSILIDNIVIYSEIDSSIKLTGTKRKGNKTQAIPKGIVVNFKLPQTFLNDVFSNENLNTQID